MPSLFPSETTAIASSPQPEACPISNLANLSNVTLLELDVTSQPSIVKAVNTVNEKTGGKLDCLVNNAGALIMMPALDTDIEKAKQMYEVNVWGVFAMTKAFAPLLVQGKGTIANIGSVAGYLNVPHVSE